MDSRELVRFGHLHGVLIFAKYVNSKEISDDRNNITDAFFDYVLLGRGSADQVAKECKVAADSCRTNKKRIQLLFIP